MADETYESLRRDLDDLSEDYTQFKTMRQQQHSLLQSEVNNLRFGNSQAYQTLNAQITTLKSRVDSISPDEEDVDYDGIRSDIEYLTVELNTLKNRVDAIVNPSDDDTDPQDYLSLVTRLNQLRDAFDALETNYNEFKTLRQEQHSLLQNEVNNIRFNNSQLYNSMQEEIRDLTNTQTQQMANLNTEFDELRTNTEQNLTAMGSDLHILEEQAVRFDTPQAKTPEEKLRGRQNLGVPELDASLTVPGRSADAAKVGQELTEIQRSLSAKADRFLVGEDGLLYVYAGEEQIAALGPFAGGGGSGGGSGGGGSEPTNNAVITARNTTGWITNTISSGGKCEISFDWSSTEEGSPTGEGSLVVYVNGLSRINRGISQGNVTSNVASYLSPGRNTIRAAISDIYSNTFFLNWTVIVVSLSIRSDFDAAAAYSGPISFSYIPTGEVEKTIFVKVDDELVATETTEYSDRQMTITIPAQTHGSHTIKAWCEAVINDTFVSSNVLQYDIICKVDGNNTPIITSTYNNNEVEQYTNINIKYRVYTPQSINSTVVLKANNQVVNTITVDRTEQLWSYRAQNEGNLVLSIQTGETTKTWNITVNEGTPISEAVTEGLELYLTSKNRSNGQENPGVWTYNDISATMSNFNYVSNGWVADDDGTTVLRLSGSARVNIPLQVFARDFRNTGKTIELEFATRYVRNYDSPIISCMSGDRGFEVTSQKAILKSEQAEISTQFKEDEHVRITFVIEKRSEFRLIYIYINGIMSGVIQYPDGDDFSQISPVGITIGSNDSTVDIYNIRVYNNNLNRLQVVNNWIADTQDVDEMLERHARNNVFNAAGSIAIDKLPEYLPYMILNSEGTHLPQYKGDKVTISLQYVNPAKPSLSYIANGVQFDVQGTSSQYYARKNYKAKYKNGVVINGTQASKYAMVPNGIAASVFCFKKDVASSEGANNVELVKLYDEAVRTVYKTPAQEQDSKIRTGIDGYPMVIFENNGDSIKFVGKYNHNFDKGAENVFGFVEGDESWEVKNNTSNRVLWKSADYTGDDWLDDFEARYPDEDPPYTDSTQLAELSTFLVSTDTTAATNQALPSSVTYDGVSYSTDSAQYRLAKFKAEVGNYIEMNSMLFYYLFTELFLMVDSRAKNMFPSFMGTEVIGQ